MGQEIKLPGSEDVVHFEVLEDVLVDESLQKFTNDWLEGYRTVICHRLAVSRFKDWYNTGQLPCIGNTACSDR